MRLELRNNTIINKLRKEANHYNSLKKMTTTCRQIKGFNDEQAPCPRWGHFMYPLKDQLLIFGGYENSKYYNDLWSFDLKTLKFSKIEQSGQLPPLCSNFTMNFDEYRNRLILFGGGTLNREKINSVFELNLTTYEWKRFKWDEEASCPWQRAYHCAEIIDRYLIVFGGEFFHDFGDLWIFDLIEGKWKEIRFPVGSIEPLPRKFASSFVWGNKMYIFSGCRQKFHCLSDMYFVDFTTFLSSKDMGDLSWQIVNLKNQNLIKRWGHVCSIRDTKVYVFGGRYKNNDLYDIVEIDLVSERCEGITVNGSIPKGRRRPGFCMKNNTLFCHSGFDGNYIKDFFYMPLMSLPKQPEEKPHDLYFQQLKLEFNPTQPQEFDSSLESDIIVLDVESYSKCIEYINTHIKAPLKIKGCESPICGSNFIKKSVYFECLLRFEVNEVELYFPIEIPREDYENIVKIFVLYMQLGKIIFDQQMKQKKKKYLDYLVVLSEYYCLSDLEEVVLKYKFEKFLKRLNSKKFTLSNIAEEAANIKKTNSNHGQYACYHMIIKIIEESTISNVEELKKIISLWVDEKEMPWLLDMIEKYQFQIFQRILHRDKIFNENKVTFPADWIPNKTGSNSKIGLFDNQTQVI